MPMPLADAMALLRVPSDYARTDIATAFSREAKRAHPDLGGTDEQFRRLVEARDRLLAAPPDLESLPRGARIPLPAYARRCNRSMRTIDRWISDPSVEFPRIFYIRGRRYLTAGDALDWERKQPDLLAANKRPTGYALIRASEKATPEAAERLHRRRKTAAEA